MPDDFAVGGVDGERRTPIAVVGADVQQAVVVGHGDLLHVAVLTDLPLPHNGAGVLVERDEPVAPAMGEDQALTDGDATPGQRAAGLAVDPLGDAGRAVHGVDVAEGRLDVQHSVDGDGGALVGPAGQAALDAVDPGGTEPAQVAAVDAVERGVVLVAVVAADLGKVPGQRRGAGSRDAARGRCRIRLTGGGLRQRGAHRGRRRTLEHLPTGLLMLQPLPPLGAEAGRRGGAAGTQAAGLADVRHIHDLAVR
ncbi:hypothetical protein GCM10027610_037550 [Dactylosporangium cerinum]